MFHQRRRHLLLLLILGIGLYAMTPGTRDALFNVQRAADPDQSLQERNAINKHPVIADVMKFRWTRYNHYQRTQLNRTGPGEQGEPVNLTQEEQQLAEASLSEDGGSYKIVSDMISLERGLPDNRPQECRQLTYRQMSLTVSVIITFCNDAPSLILRTAHSVVNRSPPNYLREVILINDHSDRADLGSLLEETVAVTWPDGIVRVVHTSHRSGVAGTRMVGIRNATGDVIVSLDGHVEVVPGWLEPILLRLTGNPDALLCPILGAIDSRTFRVNIGSPWVLDFTVDMMNRPFGLPPVAPEDATKPIRSMASMGGAWAMMRKTFLDLGGYDAGMTAWGGEDFEMALRVWLCAERGSVEMIPCSYVVHLFRNGPKPYHTNNGTKSDYGMKNFQRTAEVWLDEYKPLFYLKHPDLKTYDFGDISAMNRLKEKLHCRSFRWFLETIATHKIWPRMDDVLYHGQVTNIGTKHCLDVVGGGNDKPLGLFECQHIAASTQYYTLASNQILWAVESCLICDGCNAGQRPTLAPCERKRVNAWSYNKSTKEIIQLPLKLCLDSYDPRPVKGEQFNYVTINKCNGKPSQQWTWQINAGSKS